MAPTSLSPLQMTMLPKLLSVSDVRPNDAGDLRALADVALDADWTAVDDAVGLISARGYARGRDLASAAADLRRMVVRDER